MSRAAPACPFKVGDRVVYSPDYRGIYLESNSPVRLEPGKTYVVNEVQKGEYIIVAGYHHPLGGLHWTSFKLA